jgi:hypothetical protein
MLYEFVCSNFGGFGNDEKRINAYEGHRQGIVGKIGWYLHILIFKLLKKMQMLKKSLIDLATEKDLAAIKITAGNFPTVKTSEIVDTDKMPTSCEDLQRMGQQISGIFLVKGSKKMEAIHCKFNSKGRNEKLYDFSILFIFYSLYNINRLIHILCRQTAMDRLRRRQIRTRSFLRPENFFIHKRTRSDSIPTCANQRGKCHGFKNGEIQAPRKGVRSISSRSRDC